MKRERERGIGIYFILSAFYKPIEYDKMKTNTPKPEWEVKKATKNVGQLCRVSNLIWDEGHCIYIEWHFQKVYKRKFKLLNMNWMGKTSFFSHSRSPLSLSRLHWFEKLIWLFPWCSLSLRLYYNPLISLFLSPKTKLASEQNLCSKIMNSIS